MSTVFEASYTELKKLEDENARLRDLLAQARTRAGNLAALLESAAIDARNIQMPGLLSNLTQEQQNAALKNRDVDV